MYLFVEPWTAPTASSPRFGITMGLTGPVTPIVSRRVASQLAADCARRALQQSSNLALGRTRHAVRRNAISFFLGELVIRHGCNPFLPDEVAASITAHPLAA
jgi:hypothetical protein